jgi:hypothetical protein
MGNSRRPCPTCCGSGTSRTCARVKAGCTWQRLTCSRAG